MPLTTLLAHKMGICCTSTPIQRNKPLGRGSASTLTLRPTHYEWSSLLSTPHWLWHFCAIPRYPILLPPWKPVLLSLTFTPVSSFSYLNTRSPFLWHKLPLAPLKHPFSISLTWTPSSSCSTFTTVPSSHTSNLHHLFQADWTELCACLKVL